ncbi:unnamed protein product [Rhizoctonia solani]|uniref:Hydrolase Mb2248c n=1 Tax=Rhizoctonia solani TaxID=456999 RepID=A0A8H3CCD2_9AGAM|nr:unnamed protein product [Rhizoctonia solani]
MAPMLGILLVGFGLAAIATGKGNNFPLPGGYHRFAPRSRDLNWGYCSDTSVRGRECARFEVPLDWHNATVGKASLAVARYKAVNAPKLGTLFLNPGGPGGSGVGYILDDIADYLMTASGGKYDLVSWDPRGVGESLPRAECFKTGAEEQAFWNGTIASSGLEARGNFTDKRDLDAFYDQVDEIDTLLTDLGRRCIAYSPDTFEYIGSAAAVRDMVAIHDILEGPDKPIDFWGVSYGTVIGSYFINMFPKRVGRVVLDGVVDPLWEISLESADEAFEGFCSACAIAGPSRCAIAKQNSTTTSIRQWTRELLDKAYDYKREFGANANLSSAEIRLTLFNGIHSPTDWPSLAETLAHYYNILWNMTSANATHVKRTLTVLGRDGKGTNNTTTAATAEEQAPDYSFQGVTCADAVDAGNITTKDVFDLLVRTTRDISTMFGPIWGDGGFYCHHWPVRAVERFTGPWNKTLSNTVLVIGNEADPITPFISAKKVADALGDSAVLIKQDDYGHVSFAMHSNCTVAALRGYFLHNKLPTQDIFCGTDQVLFPGPDGNVTKATVDRAKAKTASGLEPGRFVVWP